MPPLGLSNDDVGGLAVALAGLGGAAVGAALGDNEKNEIGRALVNAGMGELSFPETSNDGLSVNYRTKLPEQSPDYNQRFTPSSIAFASTGSLIAYTHRLPGVDALDASNTALVSLTEDLLDRFDLPGDPEVELREYEPSRANQPDRIAAVHIEGGFDRSFDRDRFIRTLGRLTDAWGREAREVL